MSFKNGLEFTASQPWGTTVLQSPQVVLLCGWGPELWGTISSLLEPAGSDLELVKIQIPGLHSQEFRMQ